MVNIFSFFTGKKKKSKRSSWTGAPTQASTAHLASTSSSTYAASTPAQQSVKRQTSRFLSLRTRSSSRMIESPEDALRRQSSIGSLRRKASRSVSKALPKFGFEDGHGGKEEESLGGQLGVSGATLGLENLVGPPKLRESEVAVIYAVELSVDEVKACWETFGKALRDTGCDTVGLMLPQHHDSDSSTVQRLLALFLLHHQPSLAPSFPSITSYAASQTPRPLYSDLLRNALNDRPHPHELCDILKFSLQHLTPSQAPLVDAKTYIDFVQAEHAATYPLDSYLDLFLPRLGLGIGACLHSVFEVLADIASKSEFNMMSGGKLCLLLGWWFGGSRRGGDQSDWQTVYKEWQIAGQRVEHLFYAWIRSQSTKAKLPTRLMELVEQYPFGESTLSTDHLPLPPPSSFPRHTLHIELETETKLASISPADLLKSALQATASSDTPLLARLQSLATAQEDQKTYVDHVVQLESQGFLKRSALTSSALTPSNPKSNCASTDYLNLPTSTSARSVDKSAHPQLTPLLELSQELGNLAGTHPKPKTLGQRDANSLTTAKKADWDDFSKTGFGDAPETVTKFDLQLSPRVSPLPLSPSPSSTGPLVPATSVHSFKAIREERIEIDDAFLPFVEDSQLDKSNQLFGGLSLVRLSADAALELSGESTVEWLIMSVIYKAPAPLPVPPSTLRSASPSKESTMTRKRFSLGGFTSNFRRSSSMALKVDDATARRSMFGGTGTSKNSSTQGGLEPLQEGAGGDTAKMAQQAAPQVLAVGEMGELLERPPIASDVGDKSLDPLSPHEPPVTSPIRPTTQVDREIFAAETSSKEELTHVTNTHSAISASIPAATQVEAPAPHADEPFPPSLTTTSLDAQLNLGNPSLGSNAVDWHYIAEGGANLVLGYHGSSETYRNKALRIPKSLIAEGDGDVPDLSILWRDELLPRVLSADHLPDVTPVSLDGPWVAVLFKHVHEVRPDFRTEIDPSDFAAANKPVKATLMTDLRTTSSDVSHTVLAIEIKPKWGFLPQAQHVCPSPAAKIKSEHSRYELHQHMRSVITEYEPLDLYSGDEKRMETAMQALWNLWSTSEGQSNSWRVFVNGQAVEVGEVSRIPGVVESDDVAAKTIPILVPILHRSGVMQRLQQLQTNLDGTDISHLAQRFATECPQSELFHPTLLPQPSAEEVRQFVDLYLSDPDAGKSDKWSLRESILAYALSATFKDCSIFITCPLVSTPSGWKLDEAEATVKVIDLDLKPVASMRKWYDLDEKIWRHWHDTKSSPSSGSIEESQPINHLETPIQLHRGAIPSRLASSSTEALFVPTPDRQIHDPLDHIGATPSLGRGIRAVSALDASSTRALHTRTPEDSQPATPTAEPTPVAATPASMSLSDALFLSPPPAATPPATTPGSMSLADALFTSPPPVAASIAPTPASMSSPDALFDSPSNAMTYAEDNRTQIPTFPEEVPGLKETNYHEDETDKGTKDNFALKPDTPKRMTRSAGPSPSPGLVAAASTLPEHPSLITADELDIHSTSIDSMSLVSVTQITTEKEAKEDHPLLEDPTAVAGNPPTLPRREEGAVPKMDSTDVVQVDESAEPARTHDLPSTPTPAEQQHFRSVIAGITSESTDESTTDTTANHISKTPPADDLQHSTSVLDGINTGPMSQVDESDIAAPTATSDPPTTPTAEDQQRFRAVLAGIEVDKKDNQSPATDLLTTSTIEQQRPLEDIPATGGPDKLAARITEPAEVPQAGSGFSTSTDLEDTGMTPPFVTPMGFGEEVEPTYANAGNSAKTSTSNDGLSDDTISIYKAHGGVAL